MEACTECGRGYRGKKFRGTTSGMIKEMNTDKEPPPRRGHSLHPLSGGQTTAPIHSVW